jgi:hypothetical protein
MDIDKKRVLVQSILAQLDINICGASEDVLPALINAVHRVKGTPYLFLWTGDGVSIAHGLFPQIENKGSVFNATNAQYMASLVPDLSAKTLQNGIITVVAESLSIGRVVSYPWLETIKYAYVIRLLIGDKVYIFGA